MANSDNPNGFFPFSTGGQLVVKEFQVNDTQTIAKGDAVILSSGKASIALSNSGTLLGVSTMPKVTATAAATDVIQVAVGDHNNAFRGQCSGTFAVASHVGAPVDIEGTTGIMEVNEDANTEKVVQVFGYALEDEVGANTHVYFTILRSAYNGLVAAL